MMKKNEIPAGVMHEPSAMAWAQLTSTREHMKNEIEPVVVDDPDGNPLPVSRATTILKRAHPYIFNCAAYMQTHYRERIKETEFYKVFSMPIDVFYRYCLDDCTEQTQYLKKEIYETLTEGKSNLKHIRVSKDRTVLARPIIVALSHTALEAGIDERIKKIDQDKKVDKIEIQILKELMTYEHGYLNVPKAFYAKTKHIYNAMMKNAMPFIEKKDDYRALLNHAKSIATEPIDGAQAARIASKILEQCKVLTDIEQGDFHKIYLCLEYILINRKRNAIKQAYNLLKLCEKCAPEYTQETDGKLYYKDKKSAQRLILLTGGMIKMFNPDDKEIIGIGEIGLLDADSWDTVEVIFK